MKSVSRNLFHSEYSILKFSQVHMYMGQDMIYMIGRSPTVTVTLVTSLIRWLYDGDCIQMLMADSLSWIFSLYLIGHQHLKLVTNTFHLQHPSPTLMQPIRSPNHAFYSYLNWPVHWLFKIIQNTPYNWYLSKISNQSLQWDLSFLGFADKTFYWRLMIIIL